MKRILSLMIVAMLLVGCLSTMAFAEGGERTGTISLTIGGNEFSSFGGTISVSSPAKITGISGGAVGGPSGKVGFATMGANVSGVSVTVSVSVPANYCGTVSASFSQDEGKQAQFNGDGSLAGYIDVSLSGAGSTTFAHSYGEWTETKGADCVTAGTKTATCSICGDVADETGPYGDHVYEDKWSFDDTYHYHVCKHHPNVAVDHEAHIWGDLIVDVPAAVGKNGEGHYECTKCDAVQNETLSALPNPPPVVPPMGDITPYGTYNAIVIMIAVFALCGTALIGKRKAAK